MTNTPNKNLNNQATGANVNTWGINLNSNFSILDLNLGGRLTINVGGSSNITVTANQAQNLIHVLQGVLTGNVKYILPAVGGFYIIRNETTGAFTLRVDIVGDSLDIIVPQGQSYLVYTNPDDSTIFGTQIGSNYYSSTSPTTGTANVQVVTADQLNPNTFSPIDGTLVSVIPSVANTGSATINIGGSGNFNILKMVNTGAAMLVGGEFVVNVPALLLYISNSWLLLNPPLGAAAYENLNAANSAIVDDGSGNLRLQDSAFLSGIPTAPTAAIATNTNQIATMAAVFSATGSFLNVQYLSGAGTYTPTARTTRIIAFLSGGGGGGGGSGQFSSAGNGVNGGNTTLGSISATGGGGGGASSSMQGGSGGGGSGGNISCIGSSGTNGSPAVSSAVNSHGGSGACGFFGVGSGRGGIGGSNGNIGFAIGGGGGGAGGNTNQANGGGGGGGGGFTMFSGISSSPLSYSVGSGGAGGAAGSVGFTGAAGGPGLIIVLEFT